MAVVLIPVEITAMRMGWTFVANAVEDQGYRPPTLDEDMEEMCAVLGWQLSEAA